MKQITFEETLEIKDIQKINYYIFRKQKKYLINQIIFIVMSLLIIGLAIHKQDLYVLIFGCCTLIFSVFLFMPIYKKMIYRVVTRKIYEPMCINLSFDDDGFVYLLKTEDPNQFPKYTYDQVAKVTNLPEFILLHFPSQAIGIIKKSECEEIDELVNLLESKFDAGKYIKEHKMPR